ncbi:MAG TPA: 2-C-methyl-D-erythritol 2,4-cyclodiphosphate synthase [Vicinamibacteria bacterium]|nr:2-C-methyl-D-erythritol 2,4-cyclodiphosphate synthase [Vicinamibacteria bacterium]
MGPQRTDGGGERAIKTIRTGIGFDAHRLVEGRPLVLGGERIDYPRGLEGHSDGDALLHALTDALLGSVGALDIGALFPSGDPKWKGAESRVFLERAVAMVGERGYRVSSIDVVVIAEAPKLAPYWPAIRERLSKLLGIDPGMVGLKATTTDGMGFTGRGEGIAVQAAVTVAS